VIKSPKTLRELRFSGTTRRTRQGEVPVKPYSATHEVNVPEIKGVGDFLEKAKSLRKEIFIGGNSRMKSELNPNIKYDEAEKKVISLYRDTKGNGVDVGDLIKFPETIGKLYESLPGQ
jgi:hypothetical protein